MTDPDPRLDYDTCFISIVPGGSHAETQAWAAMLYRQYRRFAERRGYELRLVSVQEVGAGIAGVILEVRGAACAQQLAGEHGVHRLVRVSPFVDGPRRCTSFASVECVPGLIDSEASELNSGDVRVTAEGHCGMLQYGGDGQGTPIRITHVPRGISFLCSTGTQQEILDLAMRVLRAKVYAVLASLNQAQERSVDEGKVSWGSAIRSYVLDPYEMVKDVRCGVETSDTAGVLDGDLDLFIDS